MKRFYGFLAILSSVMFLSGCGTLSETVPPGHVGMVMRPTGMTNDVIQPGSHACFGRDRIALIETKELTATEKLSILCKDDLNFQFDVKVRFQLKSMDGKTIAQLLSKQGANIQWNDSTGVLKMETLYVTYLQPVVRSVSRSHVSQYETIQIREARSTLQKAIQKDIIEGVKKTPLEVTMITTSNFDYPDVIEKAMTKKREREISIGEERAKQAMALLQAENRLKIAQKMKIVRAAEAEAEAAYVKIRGESITDKYLRLKDIEAQMKLYEKVGAGDKVIITNGNEVSPLIDSRGAPKQETPSEE